jgi:EpsD family peptidyl-prolyl cis-trans isomerase
LRGDSSSHVPWSCAPVVKAVSDYLFFLRLMSCPPKYRLSRWRTARVVIAILGLALVACTKGDEKKASTQVAARVNGDEISIHQINDVLIRNPVANTDNAVEMKQRILSGLVDRQLAVQKAQELKLHRTPSVVAAIESARNEILARAYFEQLGAGQTKPDEQEAKAYFGAHPELFSERRLFTLQELLIPGRTDLLTSIKEQVAQGKSMNALEAWLKATDVKFTPNSGVRSAEQIPLEILPALHGMKDGSTTVLDDARAITITHIVSSQTKPVDEARALPAIQRFLANKKASEFAKQEMENLRASAKIEYLGEFAGTRPAAVSSIPLAPNASPASKTNLERGIAGLR